MSKSRTIVFLAYDGFQLLDVTGPLAVFAAANHELKRRIYGVAVVSAAGGAVDSDSGVALATSAIGKMPARRVDTLLIAGAEEAALRAVIANPPFAAGFRAARRRRDASDRYARAPSFWQRCS